MPEFVDRINYPFDRGGKDSVPSPSTGGDLISSNFLIFLIFQPPLHIFTRADQLSFPCDISLSLSLYDFCQNFPPSRLSFPPYSPTVIRQFINHFIHAPLDKRLATTVSRSMDSRPCLCGPWIPPRSNNGRRNLVRLASNFTIPVCTKNHDNEARFSEGTFISKKKKKKCARHNNNHRGGTTRSSTDPCQRGRKKKISIALITSTLPAWRAL